MRRLLAAAMAAVLVVALAIPSVAFARKGGVPASARGRGHGAASAAVEQRSETDKPDKAKEGKASKPAPGMRRGVGSHASGDASRTPDGQEPGTQLRERDRAGIANALERLQSNLARMQAQLEAGQRRGLPPGLQRVIAKFLGWLGLDGGAAEEPSDGGPSEEPTGTVEPTATVEPTGTVDPGLVEPAPAL